MSIGLSEKNKTAKKELSNHIAEFIKKGGQITHLPYGVPNTQRFTFNNKRKPDTPK